MSEALGLVNIKIIDYCNWDLALGLVLPYLILCYLCLNSSTQFSNQSIYFAIVEGIKPNRSLVK